MNRITTVEQVKRNGRFLSSKIEDRRIFILIQEAEQMYLKSQIGEALYIDILHHINAENKENVVDYQMLLDGGVYTTEQAEKRCFVGLTHTLNYYVYALLLRHQNYTLTRSGMVTKGNEYASSIPLRERMMLEKDTLSVADSYRRDCLLYLETNKESFPLFHKGKTKNRLNFKLIKGKK